jgi:outer membrane protein TolC
MGLWVLFRAGSLGYGAEISLQAPLTLSDLIELALARNPQITAAQQEIQVQVRGADIAKRQRFPRIDANLGYLGSFVEEKQIIPRALLKDRPQTQDKFANNIGDVSVTFSVPLYTGGRLSALVAIGELASQVAENRLSQTRNDLVFNISSTYHTILRIREDIKATKASLQALEEARKNISLLLDVGKAAQVDLFKINTRVAAVTQELIRVKNALELAHAGLNTLLGLEDVTQRLDILGQLTFTPQAIDLSQSLTEALERRPEIQIVRRQVEIQEQQVRIARSERLPQIQLNSRYLAATGDTETFRIDSDGTVGVSLSIPLFTSGVISARIGQAEAQLARVREELRQQQLIISLEVERAYLNLVEAQERQKTAEAALVEAREALRIEQMKLQLGKGIVEDLLDAQAAELQAETNLFRALADANIALAELRRAVGSIETFER